MGRIGRRKRARNLGSVADFSVSVFAAGRTWRDFPIPIQFDVIRYVIFNDDGAVGFAFLQRPPIYRAINLTKIVDTPKSRIVVPV